MADLTKSASAGVVDVLYDKPQTRKAGAELEAGDAVYIDSNGLFQKAVSTVGYTGETGTIAFAGLTAKAIPSGTFGEIYGMGVEFYYAASGLTIGNSIWGSATAGKIGDARVGTATDRPIALVVSATNIILQRGV